MDGFIKPYQYNHIKKLMKSFDNTFTCCVDKDMIESSKYLTQEKILNLFSGLTEEQISLLSINSVDSKLQIETYIHSLKPYMKGMEPVTKAQIKRLFKKEKNLRLPSITNVDFSKLSYLGWRDLKTSTLYIVYYLNGELTGLICRALSSEVKGSNICALCGRSGKSDKVAFVSVVKKKSVNYKSLGFTICLDSEQCNEKIISVEKLEELIQRTS